MKKETALCRHCGADVRSFEPHSRFCSTRDRSRRERAISIAPLITELADEVLVMRTKYQNGEDITHAVGEIRNALENLEDALDKNREAAHAL